MSDSNSAIIRKGYEDFTRGDIPAVFAALDAPITWHIPGHSPLSGDFTGTTRLALSFGARCNFRKVRSV